MKTQIGALSFSGIKDFKGCARRFHSVKVLKQYVSAETEATRYGKLVHSALELFVRDGDPLPDGLDKFQGVAEAVKAIPGDIYCEHEMALTADLRPTAFGADDAWIRGIADFIVVNNDVAHVGDWKTGSARYPDKDQLELMALMVFEHFPEVKKVKGALIFIAHDVLVKAEYLRDNKQEMWRKWVDYRNQIETANVTGVWNPNPTALCGYCPVEHCEHRVARRR